MLNIKVQSLNNIVFGSTLAASGAAFEEMTHATEEIHHKEVCAQHLAHVEDD